MYNKKIDELMNLLYETGLESFVNNLKFILFKEFNTVFKLLDFNNNDIWYNPFFIALINNENIEKSENNILQQFIFFVNKNQLKSVKLNSDNNGSIFIPYIGWYINAKNKSKLNLTLYYCNSTFSIDNADYLLLGIKSHRTFCFLDRPIEILDFRFYNFKNKKIKVNIIDRKHYFFPLLVNSIELIKKYSTNYYNLLEKSVKYILLFTDNTDENADVCEVNSVSNLSVQGIAFLNVYQPWYNEAYFIDELTYISSKLVYNLVFYDKLKFFHMDCELIMTPNSKYGIALFEEEDRSYNMHFQSIFSINYSLTVMFEILSKNVINNHLIEKELIARIGFYLIKQYNELEILEPLSNSIICKQIFKKEGLIIYNEIKNNFIKIHNDFKKQFPKKYDYSNQSYKFNFEKFKLVNII